MLNLAATGTITTFLMNCAVLAGLPDVPGLEVSEYATFKDEGIRCDGPVEMTFDTATGFLYAGRSGPGVIALSIFRVPPGGGVGEAFGDPIPDPDSVLFDATGALTDLPGALIVGGGIASGEAKLFVLAPDGSVTELCGPDAAFANPTAMDLDSAGEFVMADDFAGPMMGRVVDGLPCPSLVYEIMPRLGTMDLDADDNIYSGAIDGVIRLHSRDGEVIDSAFATGFGPFPPVGVGPGGEPWGDFLYAVNRDTGELIKFDTGGSGEVMGTGFAEARDIVFGPDGAMYLSMLSELRIIRIATIDSCPEDLDGSGDIGFNDLLILLDAWQESGPADLNGSGIVGFGDLLLLLDAWGACV